MASWLVRSSTDRAVRVRALAGDIVLCSWARHFTLTVPLSTQEYKWVPVICWGNPTDCWRVTCDGLASHPGRVEILLAASCYGNRDKLRPDEQLALRLHSTNGHFRPDAYNGYLCTKWHTYLPVMSLGLCSTSDVITFGQNWHHLYSNSARGEGLSNDTRLRVIGSVEREICTKMLRVKN